MILTILAAFAAVFGGSGVARRSSAKGRVQKAEREYQKIHNRLEIAEGLRDETLKQLSATAQIAIRCHSEALRILSPLAALGSLDSRLSSPELQSPHSLAIRNARTLSTEFHVATSIAAGAAVAGTLWFGTQAVGIASTGLPIVFLHGAALHNAALAALGGGSLATGGGGMVAGGAVLASAVAVPAGLFLGWKTHTEANRLNEIASQIESANRSNSSLLSQMEQATKRLRDAQLVLEPQTDSFRSVVYSAKKKLFRFGIFSHLFRLLRAECWGSYYTEDDLRETDALVEAVNEYRTLIETLRFELSQPH